MAAIIPLEDIPSVTSLYASSQLAHAPNPRHAPSGDANDRAGLIRGDITKLQVGAIVNAANARLLGGGGVDGAIHRAAGPGLVEECRPLGGCPTGEARITGGHDLPAERVVHTVGPVYVNDDESAPLLRRCYRASLHLAADNGVKSLAFSSISTGVYGYPSDKAAMVACRAVREFLDYHTGPLEKVIFVTFLQKDVDAYNAAIP